MKIASTLVALAATASLGLATGAQAAAPCITSSEAESITLVAIPAILQQVGTICRAELPADALLRQPSSAFAGKYGAAADSAWPAARAALGRIGGPQVQALLSSDFTRPLLTSLLAPAIIGAIEPSDCGEAEHIATLLQPLPARNTAGLIVSALRIAREKQKQAGNPGGGIIDLPLCPLKGS